jgi:antirestriction protein ArdC
MQTTNITPDFSAFLKSAVTEPGKIHAAYRAFHSYSLGNQLLALGQCQARGIAPGPIATFPRWKDLGRFVRKGEKAIELCMPVTCKRTIENTETGEQEEATFTRFVYRRNWFVLAQTDGKPYETPALPDWDKARALASLDIAEVPFELTDGNCQGYARARQIAVSSIAALPFKTTIHEMAHVVLGHTTESALSDDERTPRDIREVEAESVAMLVCAALNQHGIEYSRGYIQAWYAGNQIPESSARRILKAADTILRAGRGDAAQDSE